MLRIRHAGDRGHFDHGWLKTWHTFSFADYYDPQHVEFRGLRVLNEDLVAPGRGFGMHPHREMEIVTCVLAGALEHRDSLGHGAVLRPHEMQRMTAGTGLAHSEFNPSASESVHLYQIWLRPSRSGLPPSYEQREFPVDGRRNRWQLVASPDAADGSLRIHADARILRGNLDAGRELAWTLHPGRSAWLQLLAGSATVNGEAVSAGDGLVVSHERDLLVAAGVEADLLLFDLA